MSFPRIFVSVQFIIAAIFSGCQKEELIDINTAEYQAGVEVAILRAKQITETYWSPLAPIPKTRPEGAFFLPGKTYKGMPYSSVKEMSKFIGQDVSIHTFLSAVGNPRSVLYTDFVNAPPYHGVNCAPYYGIVCSMSVNYALGIDAPYPSRSYASAPFMQKVTKDDVDMVKRGDILASSGHTIMAVDVKRDEAGKVESIKFFENSYYIDFSREELRDYWYSGGFRLYRYKYMAQNTIVPEIEGVNPNPSLCPNRGDKSVYRSNETVVINVLNNSYDRIKLYRERQLVDDRLLDSSDIRYTGLQEGLYSVILTSDTQESEATHFEIRDVIIDVVCGNDRITISFDKMPIPATAVELCDISGDHLFTYGLSDVEKASGKITIGALNQSSPYYCKVIFQGKYGKIPSDYIVVK